MNLARTVFADGKNRTYSDCVVLVTWFERYYGIMIDIYGLTAEQVSCNVLQ